MSAHDQPLFAATALAERTGVDASVITVAGGAACFAESGSRGAGQISA
ncbi:hypothetical protein [Mycolicibacterium holsaticum]|nr:hypothetical protein [Mycolicibacterium holsaticum]MDA4110133.1 hypothetical protein [Mycolicibacterium holsaticum DSM 44478 = JCM 12374]QZA11957.1 hypothetical protein K3U96_22825 [Mycolicibacterium holsaticum DSM 44478 = JCM 12374]UNC10555.1 hypothetical protein H5U41_03990 [Mycolicibacterium holsaticum DSM 44478 = JCM 12374]